MMFDFKGSRIISNGNIISNNIAECGDRAARRPRGASTARWSVGLGLVEILSWMRHCIYLFGQVLSVLIFSPNKTYTMSIYRVTSLQHGVSHYVNCFL